MKPECNGAGACGRDMKRLKEGVQRSICKCLVKAHACLSVCTCMYSYTWVYLKKQRREQLIETGLRGRINGANE